MTRHWLAIIVALLALGIAACGGGGEKTATPTGTEEAAPTAEGTPADGYTITDNLFESEKNGYQARFPEGWDARPDFLSAPGLAVDAFFFTEEVAGVQPNITVTCEQVPEGTTLQDYFDGKMEVARRIAQVEPDVSSLEVGGQQAMMGRYKRDNVQPAIEKTEVYLLTQKCGLGINFTVPLDQGAQYQPQFDDFLSSFTLLS